MYHNIMYDLLVILLRFTPLDPTNGLILCVCVGVGGGGTNLDRVVNRRRSKNGRIIVELGAFD